MPADEEFRSAFKVHDQSMYDFRDPQLPAAEAQENFERKEPVNVDSYTIEHVMPQNPDLSPEWQQELGPEWQTMQERYLHTIGNLTLTGYDSELSDKPFESKLTMKGGFEDSPLRLDCRELATLEHWNEQEDRRGALVSSPILRSRSGRRRRFLSTRWRGTGRRSRKSGRSRCSTTMRR